MLIRKVTKKDAKQVYDLYKVVAKTCPGQLTQYEDEITLKYIKNEVINKSLKFGLILVIEEDKKIVGSLKAYTSPYRCLAHALTNATMMVHPDYQNKKYGTHLIKTYLKTLEKEFRHIYRFELLPHHLNERAIKFYKKNGFIVEVGLRDKIMNVFNKPEPEVILIWFNKKFSKRKLLKYYKYLKTLN